MSKPKMKIILAAINLFNERGIVGVLNQDIANAAGISLSNFNYHFKTKAHLVFAVCAYMREVLKECIEDIHVLSSDGKGLDLSKMHFEFSKNFRFFYLETHSILQIYPDLKKELRLQIDESIQVIRNLNYLAIGMGQLKPEPPEFPGLYDQLSEQIWINSHFWLVQMSIRGVKDYTIIKGLEAYYAICYPYLTEKGIKSYKGYIENTKQEITESLSTL